MNYLHCKFGTHIRRVRALTGVLIGKMLTKPKYSN